MANWITYGSYSLYYDGSDMTDEETEFLLAVASYQKRFKRRYPTWLEVMHILRCLGYRKVGEPVPITEPQPPPEDSDDPTPGPSPKGRGEKNPFSA